MNLLLKAKNFKDYRAMSDLEPVVKGLQDTGLGLLSTVMPSDVSDATLATTTLTTKVSTGASHTESTALSYTRSTEMGGVNKTFLLLFGQAVPLVLLATVTVVSNLMVLLMFRVKRSLRSCKNMYLASLAVADLLVGTSMFVAILQQLRGKGPKVQSGIMGEAYHVIRQAALYVSLLSLMLITVDRWWSIHRPFSYRARRRKRNAALAVGTIWLLSFALHIVPVIIWEFLNASNCALKKDDTPNTTIKTYQRPNAYPVFNISNTSFSLSNIFFSTTSNNETNISLLLPSPPSSRLSKSFLSNCSVNAHSKLSIDLHESMTSFPNQQQLNIDERNSVNQNTISRNSHRLMKSTHGVPLYEGLSVYSDSPLASLAWDVQYLVPLLAMLTLNCSLYVGILRRKRVQIRRSLTSFNRLSTSITDRRNSVSSMPNFYIEASSSLDENAELLLSSAKSKDIYSGDVEGGTTSKPNPQRSTASITNINTKFNFYSSSTETYKQLQQQHHQTRPISSSSTLRSSVSMPHVHLSTVDAGVNLHDKNKTPTAVLNNNNNNNITNGLPTNPVAVAPLRRFSWAPRKASLALNRRSKGSEELAKDLLVRQDRKAACWLGLLVVVSLVCWLPHTILRVLRAMDAVDIPSWVLDTAIWVQLANSSINPMLYGFFNKEIRQAFKQWMRGGSRRKRAKFKNALLLYGCNINSGVGGHTPCARRMSLFNTVLE